MARIRPALCKRSCPGCLASSLGRRARAVPLRRRRRPGPLAARDRLSPPRSHASPSPRPRSPTHERRARDRHRSQQRHRRRRREARPSRRHVMLAGRDTERARPPRRRCRRERGPPARPRGPRVGARVRAAGPDAARPADQQRRRHGAAAPPPPTASSCRSAPTTSATSRSPSCCCRTPRPRRHGLQGAHRPASTSTTSRARRYRPWPAYSQSKLANLLFTSSCTVGSPRPHAGARPSPPTPATPPPTSRAPGNRLDGARHGAGGERVSPKRARGAPCPASTRRPPTCPATASPVRRRLRLGLRGAPKLVARSAAARDDAGRPPPVGPSRSTLTGVSFPESQIQGQTN